MPEAVDSSILGLLTLSSGLGLILAWLALRADLLEGRVRPGRCAACGRRVDDGRPVRARRRNR